MQHEVDRLAVVFLHQLLELHQRLVEGVIVVELHGAVERDDLLGLRRLSAEIAVDRQNAAATARIRDTNRINSSLECAADLLSAVFFQANMLARADAA